MCVFQISLAALRSQALSSTSSAESPFADFVSAYFENADPQELQVRDFSMLCALARAHWRLLNATPNANGARIRVFNPSLAEDGFVSEHTVIQIVHDDMPFLVDSVTMSVNRSGRMAHWIVHPLLTIERNAQAQVLYACPALRETNSAHPVASLILLECDRILLDSERLAMEQDLADVLHHVSAVVRDWRSMLEQLQVSIQTSVNAPLPAASLSEGLAFAQWLQDQHFTFLGACTVQITNIAGVLQTETVQKEALGLLSLALQAQALNWNDDVHDFLSSQEFVSVSKSMTRSSVHRPSYLDCISIKLYDTTGTVTGVSRFIGLYTSKAYAAAVDTVPMIRQRCADVISGAGVVPDSHAAKALQAILEAYPRDELFQIDTPTLMAHATGILRLQERQRTRIFIRRDAFRRFVSLQVFVPRDRFNTELRSKIGDELCRVFEGQSIDFTPMLTDSPLARIHYIVRTPSDTRQDVDLNALEARIAQLARRWEDDCRQELIQTHGESMGSALALRFSSHFPNAYREDFSAAIAAADTLTLSGLINTTPLAVRLYRPLDSSAGLLRFKIFSSLKVALSDSLPLLECMGARVLDERPYRVADPAQASSYWIHDLGLQFPASCQFAEFCERFESLFLQVWSNQIDSDDLNRLILTTKLDARAIAILRAYTRYFKQLGLPFGQSYLESALLKNPSLAELLYQIFDTRLNPAIDTDRDATERKLCQSFEQALTLVVSLDEERILQQYLSTLLATVRTNAWQTSDGGFKSYLSFKLNPKLVFAMPEPKPQFEIWVYSPRLEGLHLRFGKVARGGLRWSDRREDFRTEILGLVKAQQVKNTVIVPVGSKGGFVLKREISPADRDAYMAEGIACYQLFLCGLLDLTDNLQGGLVVAPVQLVRHDADDPYLVVAADKGTASFSDIANAISRQYKFWLGDAFASGGSVGYDHKKMGITARGAWESAKRHFRSLGRDIQTQAFTVVGIGDMSGDVFGNGMLLSKQIRLVAAFDHRHIFIDPNPDAASSFAQRQRLFDLSRSSWDDYDRSIMSEGSGIYPRSAKSIPLSEPARQVLGIEATELTPNDLLHALLKAPVDMLYNGGIGTYVKSSSESHAQAGDKAGDAFRVNGKQLRCKVLVEGGNLGCTQSGRIEFAQAGGLIYSDAIDNSGGVDCSDHEVNIKILLDRVVEAGDLTLKQRNDLLASMTDELGLLVLSDNYYQTQAIDIAVHRPLYWLNGQQQLMHWLEGGKRLNRTIEFLPTDDVLALRRVNRQGLTAPENAVLLAYAKMAVFDDLLVSNLPDDPYFDAVLRAYFPQILSENFALQIAQHPLKREIIANFITNTVVNRVGATFVNFLAAEAAATTADVVRAYTLAREIFDLESIWDNIDALDHGVDSKLQLDLLCTLIATVQRASRWILRLRSTEFNLPTLIARYQPGARELAQNLQAWLPSTALAQWDASREQLEHATVSPDLAHRLCALVHVFPALDLVDLAEKANTKLELTAKAYFAVDTALNLNGWRTQIKRLPTETVWKTQARASARDEIDAIASHLTFKVLTDFQNVAAWTSHHAASIARSQQLLQSISMQEADLAPISVALRDLRHLAKPA
jgi:glutamate dehydrogenase